MKSILLIEPPFFRLYKETYSLAKFPLSLGYLAGSILTYKKDWNVKVINADFSPVDDLIDYSHLTGVGFKNYLKNLKDINHIAWRGIKKAIEETNRRRSIQLAYNKKHKIDAKTVKKEINDILESVYEKDYVKISEGSNVGGNLKKHLKALDKKMKEAASNLEFEEAAKIRDEIRKLESTELEITLNPKIRQYDVKNKLYPKGRSTMGMPGTKVTKKRDKKWKHRG